MKFRSSNITNVLIVFTILLFLPLVNSAQPSLGTFKKGDCISLVQTCESCTYNNISYVLYPNSSTALSNVQMTRDDTFYNYTFCDTNIIGEYLVNGFGDEDGTKEVWVYDLKVTGSGDSVSTTQGFVLLAQFGIVALFFGLGRVFSREKWKVKLFFDLSALLMGVILLNSIRVVSAQANALNSMGEVGLYLGMVILLFLFMYMFIHALIEVFGYFKNKKKMKWEVSNNP